MKTKIFFRLLLLLLLGLGLTSCTVTTQTEKSNLGVEKIEDNACLQWAEKMFPKVFLMQTSDSKMWEFAVAGIRYNKWSNGDTFNPSMEMTRFEKGSRTGENVNLYYHQYREFSIDYQSGQITNKDGEILGNNQFTIVDLKLKPRPETVREWRYGYKIMYFDVEDYSIDNCKIISEPEEEYDSEINLKIPEDEIAKFFSPMSH